MTRKFILLLIIHFFLNTGNSQIKSGKVIYKKTSEYKIQNKNIDSEINELTKNVDNYIKEFTYSLIFNKTHAVYEEEKKLNIDKDLKYDVAKVFAGFIGKMYYNSLDEQTIHKKNSAGKQFLITSRIDSKKWVLENSTKLIENYLCYKAITKDTVETRKGKVVNTIVAWYCPDINFSYGPEGYCGLPGLIFQLEKNKVLTYIDELNFSKKELVINMPSEGELITKNEYIEFLKKVNSNRMEYYTKKNQINID
ncbi:GLPGLI family protein [Flaviramulus basaltis]|uniref:GLPGLI family protein n=1 Tax=Flaviramulus basaltis TaxID=369401 RepID=A0A1K2ICN9_9FLAO|nr:GLPGLI family protein [Flaviramulus basaltis]SFZ90014.1 GLPGLI family protein [Flaviramulus basaltis]